METETITLSQALEIMNLKDRDGKPFPFDISFRTFSAITKTGGELKVYEGCTYLPSAKPGKEIPDTIYNLLDPVKAKKDPNHFENRTRNITLADGQTMRKLNIDFIDTINHYKVIY